MIDTTTNHDRDRNNHDAVQHLTMTTMPLAKKYQLIGEKTESFESDPLLRPVSRPLSQNHRRRESTPKLRSRPTTSQAASKFVEDSLCDDRIYSYLENKHNNKNRQSRPSTRPSSVREDPSRAPSRQERKVDVEKILQVTETFFPTDTNGVAAETPSNATERPALMTESLAKRREFLSAVQDCLTSSRTKTPVTLISVAESVQVPRFILPTESFYTRTFTDGESKYANKHPYLRPKTSSFPIPPTTSTSSTSSTSSSPSLLPPPQTRPQSSQKGRKQITPDAFKDRSVLPGYDLHITARLLKLEPHQRTPSDVGVICKHLRRLKAFVNLSDFMLSQVAGVVKYCEYASDKVVFRQGDVGTSWFVVLGGSVSVGIKFDDAGVTKIVTTLKQGDGFGELALVQDKPRAATIMTLEKCDFARVDRVDYNRIVKVLYDIESKQKLMFMRYIPLFDDYAPIQLRSMAGLMKWRKLEAGQELIQAGKKIEEFYFIETGFLEAYAVYTIPGTQKKVLVKVGEYGPNQYCCESAAMIRTNNDDQLGKESSANHNTEHFSELTLKAKDEVKLYSISAFDARTKFRNDLVISEPVKIATSPEKLKAYYENQEARKAWAAYKNRIMTRLISERVGDATAKADFYIRQEKLKSLEKGWNTNRK